jgi:hypothetical protein
MILCFGELWVRLFLRVSCVFCSIVRLSLLRLFRCRGIDHYVFWHPIIELFLISILGSYLCGADVENFSM